MRITRLELHAFKCFSDLVLEDLPSRVVLVGPNGSGKSTILEAIAILKEFSAVDPKSGNPVYQTNLQGRFVVAWPGNFPIPILGNEPFASISADFVLTDSEAALTRTGRTATATIRILRSGEIEFVDVPAGIRTLFYHFDPASGIGAIDYIHPQRVISRVHVQALNLQELSLDRQPAEYRDFFGGSQRFAMIKQYILSQQLSFTSGNPKSAYPLIKELFALFFAPKQLIGYVEHGTEMRVGVHTPEGDHDIDQLSSGEKELFFTLVSLIRIRALPSVILYDEPERHLNAGLEALLVPALDKIHTENQLWLATHGLELIGSLPMADIIALKRGNREIIVERFLRPSAADRIRLFEDLGAKAGLQLASKQIVFVEGEDARRDQRILDRFVRPKLPGVVFVASGATSGVLGAGTRAGLLLERASRETSFLMVLDRDYRDDASVERLEARLNHRVFVWRCHEVENLLLSELALQKVLLANGVTTFNSRDEIVADLQGVAQSLQDMFVYQWAAYRLNCDPVGGDVTAPARPRDAQSFERWVRGQRTRAEKAYSSETAEAAEAAARQAVRNCLGTGAWKIILPGKEILQGFRQRHLPALPHDLFVEQVIYRMLEVGETPEEIQRLCEFINQSSRAVSV